MYVYCIITIVCSDLTITITIILVWLGLYAANYIHYQYLNYTYITCYSFRQSWKKERKSVFTMASYACERYLKIYATSYGRCRDMTHWEGNFCHSQLLVMATRESVLQVFFGLI